MSGLEVRGVDEGSTRHPRSCGRPRVTLTHTRLRATADTGGARRLLCPSSDPEGVVRRLLVVVTVLLAACAPGAPTQATPPASTVVATPTSAASRAAEATVGTPSASRCVRAGATAFGGVVESRPDGWFGQAEIAALPGFPSTYGAVYGPDGAAVPPDEGPGRLVLYETSPASDAYVRSRIEQSRNHAGKPIAVTVCGEATEVWLDGSTGELVVGWTDRDKSDVLVANTADFTVQELVDSAESVYDCCG